MEGEKKDRFLGSVEGLFEVWGYIFKSLVRGLYFILVVLFLVQVVCFLLRLGFGVIIFNYIKFEQSRREVWIGRG